MALVAPQPHPNGEDVARAQDPSVQRTGLVALAAHRDVAVRAAVAARPDAPMGSLISLAHERDRAVLTALVDNPASPLWVIKKLATDRRDAIRDRAIRRLREMER